MKSTSSTKSEPKKEVSKTVKHQNVLDAWSLNIHLRTSHEDKSIPERLDWSHK
jgi:hypothetical protein